WRLAIAGRHRVRLADRSPIQPEDGRRERWLDRRQVRRIREVGDLDLDRADARLTILRERRDHAIDLLLELGPRDQDRRGELLGCQRERAIELLLTTGGVAERLEREPEDLMTV